MENKIGDYLYIILLIIAAISGIIRSNRKKQAARETISPDYPDDNDYIEAPPRQRQYESIFSQFEKVLLDDTEENIKEIIPEKKVWEKMEYKSALNDYTSITSEYSDLKAENTKLRHVGKHENVIKRDEKIETVKESTDIQEPEFENGPNNIVLGDLIKNKHDFKKAVILSEIINPKYI